MPWPFPPIALFANTVPRDTTILQSLQATNQATINLDDTISKWNGSTVSALPILTASSKLVGDVKARTEIARAGGKLTTEESAQCADATIKLVESTWAVIITCIVSKDKASRILIRPVVLQLLKALRGAAGEFVKVLADKVSVELEDVIGELAGRVDEPFGVGIEAYSQ